MLILAGLGLADEKDLTLRGLEEARRADRVYIELYTGKWHGNLRELERLIGKRIIELKRADLEEGSEKILKESERKRVLVFVQGDPLIVTAHNALLLDARKRGIETKVIHNASIISAIAEVGLHMQKFGPLITIPFLARTGGRAPRSTYDIIKENRERGLHTLCLLDVMAEEKRYMTVNEGIKTLLRLERRFKGGVTNESTKIIVFARAGHKKSAVVYGRMGELLERDFGELPAVLIIPGKLHFTEKASLEDAL
jgi:diphthine synthase